MTNPYAPADEWGAPPPVPRRPRPVPEAPGFQVTPTWRTRYRNADQFARAQLRPYFRRRLSSHRVWCPQWWRHEEGLVELEELWRSFEFHHRPTEDGANEWVDGSARLRDFLHPAMARLMDPEGPFAGCGPKGCVLQPPLPCDPPEAGLFGPDPLPPPGGQVRARPRGEP